MEVVRVDTADAQSLEVSVRRSSRSPICELKRGLASATGVPPVQQRVRAVAAADQQDSVEVPQRLVLVRRQRVPVLPLIIAPFAGERLVLDIDAQVPPPPPPLRDGKALKHAAGHDSRRSLPARGHHRPRR